MTNRNPFRGQPRWRIITAGAVVIALVGGAAAFALTSTPGSETQAVPTTSATPPVTPTPTPTPTPARVVPATADAVATFDGWSQDNEQDTASTFTAEVGDPADGAITLRIASTNPADNPTRRALSQVVAVAPSTTYNFTAAVKGMAEKAFKPQLAVFMGFEGQGRYDFSSTNSEWAEQTWSYTTGAAETEVPVSLLTVGPTSADVSLDQLTMTADGTTDNLLANASFETFTADNPRITNASLMLESGTEATLGVSWRVPGASWVVTDESGASVTTGSIDLQPGLAVVPLQDLDPGYYSVDIVSNDDATDRIQTSLAILDPIAPNAAATDERFGVGIHLAKRYLNSGTVAAEIGFSTVRTDAKWHLTELNRGEYTFPDFETAMFRDYANAGLTVLPISDYGNILYDKGKTPSSPAAISAYAAYTKAVVDHLDSPAVEIYNEFNNPPMNTGACGPTAECYLPLLQAAQSTVKSSHPDTRVVGPAIARHDDAWLTALYRAGGLDYLDAVSFHPYDYSPESGPEFLEGSIQQASARIKEFNNGESKPIWITELGWSTAGYSEDDQADNLVRSQAIALANGVEKFFWYDLVNDSLDPSDHEGNFGLVRQTSERVPVFAPKPSAVAQAVLIRQVSGKAFTSRDMVSDPSVHSYLFGDGATSTRVAWATSPKTATYAASGEIESTDQFGATSVLTPVDGRITVKLDGHPIYLQGNLTDFIVAE